MAELTVKHHRPVIQDTAYWLNLSLSILLLFVSISVLMSSHCFRTLLLAHTYLPDLSTTVSYSVLSVCVLLVREEDVLALLIITEFFKTCSGMELVLRYEPGTYHCAIESRVCDINVNDVVKLLYSLERERHTQDCILF